MIEEMIEERAIKEDVKSPEEKGEEIDFKITDKVANLMMRIAENNYGSRDEIGVLFTSYGYRFRLIKGLKSLGMISELKTHVIPSKVYFLTPLGYDYLDSRGLLRVPDHFNQSNFRIATCFHTLAGLEVRLIFEKHGMVSNWCPERCLFQLRKGDIKIGGDTGYRKVDAEFDFGGLHCGLEVELTLKAPRAIVEILENLKKREDLNRIIWVIRSRNIFESIRNIFQISRNQKSLLNDDQKRHFFIMLADLQANWLDANVFDLNEKSVSLEMLNE
jgi:hypothetical protein